MVRSSPTPGSVRYLSTVRAAGVRVGVVTSSENGNAPVLDAADLSRFVQVRIDGTDIARQKLRGKPAPDSFLAGARAFGVDPSNAAVFEDALSGIEAGRAGGFGYVVGVDRVGGGQHAAAMRAAGADVVVTDLAELLPSNSPSDVPGFEVAEWELRWRHADPASLGLTGVAFALSNGHIGLRGTSKRASPSDRAPTSTVSTSR